MGAIWLRVLQAALLKVNFATPDHGSVMRKTIGLGEGNSPLRVLVAPFRGRIHDDLQTVTTIVFLSTNQTTRLGDHDFLRQVYQLTVIEAKCALLLADGNSLDEIAEHLHATRHTVRSHCRICFEKPGLIDRGARRRTES